MYIILILIFMGVIIGIFFRGRDRFKKIIDQSIFLSIFLLLFFLGIEVGANEEVIKNLPTIGLKAISITVFALIGSSFFSFFLFHYIFKKVENED